MGRSNPQQVRAVATAPRMGRDCFVAPANCRRDSSQRQSDSPSLRVPALWAEAIFVRSTSHPDTYAAVT